MLRLKETKEVLDFVISLGEACASSLADGQLTLSDIPNFWEPLTNMASAAEGWQEVINEIENLSLDDIEHLRDYVIDEFDIESDTVESMIETALQTGVGLLSFVMSLK